MTTTLNPLLSILLLSVLLLSVLLLSMWVADVGGRSFVQLILGRSCAAACACRREIVSNSRVASVGSLVGGSPIASNLGPMVNLTRIYTRTGDDGSTALGDMSRTTKNDPRLVAYADVDEANSHIGLALALHGATPALRPDAVSTLTRIQNELFDVGADLCVPVIADPSTPQLRVEPEYVTRLEFECDQYNAQLSRLSSFVLPGGTPTAAALHVARTVTRRAERSTWTALAANPKTMGPLPARYLNRLSDLLFILARAANVDSGGDVLWRPGGDR